ncbi:hypothetical protein FI667_g914, partial [Globisporangium splendens]
MQPSDNAPDPPTEPSATADDDGVSLHHDLSRPQVPEPSTLPPIAVDEMLLSLFVTGPAAPGDSGQKTMRRANSVCMVRPGIAIPPTQVSMFLVGFYHLLLKSFSSVFIKCGLLFISNYKWLKIVIFLIRTNHARQRQLEIPHTRKKTKQSRRHLFFGLFFFIFFGVMLLVYTIVAIKTSTENCAPYPKCVVISYQWYAGESGCPCATYINRKTDPRTFAEWVNPVDVTDELAMVAREGQLLTVQVINRALPTLPDAMRSCKKTEKMYVGWWNLVTTHAYATSKIVCVVFAVSVLLYAKTQSIPDWAKRFTKLQYLYVR